jgi:hypothetical protein
VLRQNSTLFTQYALHTQCTVLTPLHLTLNTPQLVHNVHSAHSTPHRTLNTPQSAECPFRSLHSTPHTKRSTMSPQCPFHSHPRVWQRTPATMATLLHDLNSFLLPVAGSDPRHCLWHVFAASRAVWTSAVCTYQVAARRAATVRADVVSRVQCHCTAAGWCAPLGVSVHQAPGQTLRSAGFFWRVQCGVSVRVQGRAVCAQADDQRVQSGHC